VHQPPTAFNLNVQEGTPLHLWTYSVSSSLNLYTQDTQLHVWTYSDKKERHFIFELTQTSQKSFHLWNYLIHLWNYLIHRWNYSDSTKVMSSLELLNSPLKLLRQHKSHVIFKLTWHHKALRTSHNKLLSISLWQLALSGTHALIQFMHQSMLPM